MSLAVIKILSEDKIERIRSSISDYLMTIPAGNVVNQTPMSVYREKDGDRRFIVAVSHQAPGAFDEELQLFIVDREKIASAQSDVNNLLSSVKHRTVTGNTATPGAVTVTTPIFSPGDVGRGVESGGQSRAITTFVSQTQVLYSGDSLPPSPSTPVSLLGAEALRSVALDTYMAYDGDPLVVVSFVPGGGLASGAGPGAGDSVTVIEVNSNYTATIHDTFIAVDASAGPVVITLPSASLKKMRIHVKKIDSSSNFVTVMPSGSDVIDEGPMFKWNFPMNSYIIVGNGVSKWWVS